MRGLNRSERPVPSLSMPTIARGVIVFRFLRLVQFLFVAVGDVMALAVERWMVELNTWLDIVFREQDDRETRNHCPWTFDVDVGSNAFSAGSGE